MIIPAGKIASIGVNKDLPPQQLPIDAWTDALNARFSDSVVRSAFPWYMFTGVVEPITWLDFFRNPDSYVGAYATPTAVYAFDITSNLQITRVSGPYTGELFDYWQGDMFQGFGVINNGVDIPQVWNPVNTATALINMPAWPATVRAKVVRGFSNFLVALDVSKGGIRDIRMVKWSHSADPNTLPSSWDETDAAKEAGEVSLAQGSDGLVDCLILGEANIIYSELQTWAMTYVGSQAIFAFRNLFTSSGILAQGCAKQFGGGHFTVTQDDIVVHNGSSINSVGDAAVRRWFFKNLSTDFYKITRVIKYQQQREMWICFSSYGSVMDKALIWNWRYNTWTIRELPPVRSGASVAQLPALDVDTWETGTTTWDADTTTAWGTTVIKKENESLILAGENKTYTIGETIEGPVTTTLVRIGLAFVEPDAVDEFSFKELIAIRPSIAATAGTTVSISAGHQDTVQSAVVWDETKSFIVGTDVEVQINTTGRYLAVKFEWTTSTGDVSFFGYGLDIVQLKESL